MDTKVAGPFIPKYIVEIDYKIITYNDAIIIMVT